MARKRISELPSGDPAVAGDQLPVDRTPGALTVRVSASSIAALATLASITGTLSVAKGGTGSTTLLAGAYLKGNGTSALTFQAPPIPVADGGTGGVTAAAARASLAVAGLADANAFTALQKWAQGTNLTAAATLTLGTDGNYFLVNGATTITAISATQAGTLILLRAGASFQITAGASLLLAGAQNIVMSVGDLLLLVSEGSGTYREVLRYPQTPILNKVDSPTTVANTAAETTIFTMTLKANTLGVRHQVHVDLYGILSCTATPTVTIGSRHNKFGYGKMGILGRNLLAHRVAWIFSYGDMPKGKHVLHQCDTPSCVRPSHLFLGDQMLNVQDMCTKGRQARGKRNGLTKLTEEQVREILRLRAADGLTWSLLAKMFGVSPTAVARAVTGRTWTHVA